MADVRCLLHEAATVSINEPGLVTSQRIYLYGEFNELVSRVALNLKNRHLGGRRIGLVMQQDWRMAVILLGIIRAGGMACPVNPSLPDAAERLRALDVGAVVVDSELGNRGDFPCVDADALTAYVQGVEDFEPVRIDLQHPSVAVWTSGSLGQPKPAILTYGNLYYSARGANLNLRLRARDRWLLSLPLFHVGGLGIVFRCLMAAAAIAIPEKGQVLQAAQKQLQASFLSLVSTQFIRLLSHPEEADLSIVRAVLLGGGPVPEERLAEAVRLKWAVFTSYGPTEMASQVCAMPPTAPPAKRMTSGQLLRHRELRLAEDGEILVRGETLFAGYWVNGQLERALDTEGWFATGDLGALDADGFLRVLGRKDNRFISGGENIHPEEIERALLGLPGVADALVVPVPDAEFGYRPAAWIRWNAEPVPAESLRAGLRKGLPGFKLPVCFRTWPGDESGLKPDRRALAARMQQAAARDA